MAKTDFLTEIKKGWGRYTREPGRQLSLFDDVLEYASTAQQAAAGHPGGPGGWVRAVGIYTPEPIPQALTERAAAYARNNAQGVAQVLRLAGLGAASMAGIMTDYAEAARGNRYTTTPPAMMAEAIRKIDPRKAYAADKYLFYRLVFNNYRDLLAAVNRYKRAKDGTAEDRAAFVGYTPAPAPWVFADAWGVEFGFVDLAELGDQGARVLEWVAATRAAGAWWQYYEFCHFAAHALQATEAELDAIPTPGGYNAEFCKALKKGRGPAMLDLEENLTVEGLLLAEGQEAERPTGVLSRQLAEMGGGGRLFYKLDTAPASAIGADLRQRLDAELERGDLLKPQYETLERVITGVNILYAQGTFIAPGYNEQGKRGRNYELHTTVKTFARACGMVQPNGEQLKQLRGGMAYLHNLQFLCMVKKKKVWTAPILFQWGADGGGDTDRQLTIILPTAYVEGKSNKILVKHQQIKALQDSRQGGELRLGNILLTKNHKEEEALLVEVYNYDSELAAAEREGTAGGFIENWKKNKARRRKQLAQWFEKAKERGAVTRYERKRKSAGGKTTYVWTWRTPGGKA